MKRCFKCLVEKPLSEFYVHSRMADGHLSKCKDCAKIDVMQHRAKKLLDRNWVQAERMRCREKSARQRANGICYQSPGAPARWARRYPEKKRAETRAYRAMLRGVIKKPEVCERCKKQTDRVQMHHFDYSKPLEVVWLCSKCHGFVHWTENKNKSIDNLLQPSL